MDKIKIFQIFHLIIISTAVIINIMFIFDITSEQLLETSIFFVNLINFFYFIFFTGKYHNKINAIFIVICVIYLITFALARFK